MGQRKSSSRSPQAKHKPRSAKSQFDRRSRLNRPNPKRRNTIAAKVPLVGGLANKVRDLGRMPGSRSAFRLSIIVAGMMLADDRRVAAAWFFSAGVQDDWDCFYDCLASLGRNSKALSGSLLLMVLTTFARGANGRLTVAIDDSPTQRYGKHVEGAVVHHNPTPGPVGSKWLYGHNWVTIGLLATHPLWGVIALPLRALLYVREVDVSKLAAKYGWKFRTRHQLALERVTWFVSHARWWCEGCKIWLVADGAYAGRPLLLQLLKLDVIVFSRLRSDAVLHDLPGKPASRRRGRPRIYGTNRISLAKRAGHGRGWEPLAYRCRGEDVTRPCKTFLATSRLTGGVIRVVLIKFDSGGWAACFCSDPDIAVKDIMETISARWAIEEFFHDVKEVWGAGQQQVRNVWSNIGCWHLNLWMYTLVELCCWETSQQELVRREEHSWDNPDRRPSHADRRHSLGREMLRKQLSQLLPKHPFPEKLKALLEHLIQLAA